MDISRFRLIKDDMTRHGLMMTIFSVATGLFNYLYQIMMGRLLTPEHYGTLLSLIALFTIIAVFAKAIQTSITKFSSRFKAAGDLGKVSYLWRFSLKYSFIFGIVVFAILASVTVPLSQFLNISNYWYVIIIALSFLLTFIISANFGMLQGLQRFLPLGVSITLDSVFKLLLGILLVYIGLEVYGGLLALVLASLFSLFVTFYFLRDLFRANKEKLQTKEVFSYTGLALVALTCYLVLVNVDVILAKHFLSPNRAGDYGAISVLGKIVLFALGGIGLAMFPKTSELFEKGRSHRLVLWKAIVLSLILAGVILSIYSLFPGFVISLAFGDKYTISEFSLLKYGLAMLFFAISSLLMNYFLSMNVRGVAHILITSVLIELCLISLFHSSIEQIIDMLLISGAVSLVLLLLFHFVLSRRIDSGCGRR